MKRIFACLSCLAQVWDRQSMLDSVSIVCCGDPPASSTTVMVALAEATITTTNATATPTTNTRLCGLRRVRPMLPA